MARCAKRLRSYRGLSDLEQRKAALEREGNVSGDGGSLSDIDLPSTVADKFAGIVLSTLKAWHFPEIDRIHFEAKSRDLVINGKNRTSFGKGLRAITQAAFTVSVLQYCRQFETPHPGFVVLDSPLLSYREPEGDGDDLSGTDLNSHFFDFLAKLQDDRQVLASSKTSIPRRMFKPPRKRSSSRRSKVLVATGSFQFPSDPSQKEKLDVGVISITMQRLQIIVRQA